MNSMLYVRLKTLINNVPVRNECHSEPLGTACTETLHSVVLSSPGLGAPTLVSVEALTSRIIKLDWQVSDHHVTCYLAASDLLRIFSSPLHTSQLSVSRP